MRGPPGRRRVQSNCVVVCTTVGNRAVQCSAISSQQSRSSIHAEESDQCSTGIALFFFTSPYEAFGRPEQNICKNKGRNGVSKEGRGETKKEERPNENKTPPPYTPLAKCNSTQPACTMYVQELPSPAPRGCLLSARPL